MTPERYQAWWERVIAAARKPWLRAEADVLKGLYSVPGFAGVRSQVGLLVGLWRRAQGLIESPSTRDTTRHIDSPTV